MGRISKAIRARRAKAVRLLLAALGLLMLVSILTHSQKDPPLTNRAAELVDNWAGWLGAYGSHYLFTGLGYGAYLLGLLTLLLGLNRIQRDRSPLVQAGSLLLLPAFFCTAAAIPSGSRLGGLVGHFLASEILLPYLGRFGASVFLLVGLSIWMFLATDFLAGRTVRILRRLAAGVVARLTQESARIGRKSDTDTGAMSVGSGDGTRKGTAVDEGGLSPIEDVAHIALPDLDLLSEGNEDEAEDLTCEGGARLLEEGLKSFQILGKVVRTLRGPVVITYGVLRRAFSAQFQHIATMGYIG